VTDPRELVCLDPAAWRVFWSIICTLPRSDDPERLQLAAARRALEIAAGRWN
jgi:hypothetical protein